jgi:transcriptional regulator with XRE-family HTH domain
MSNDNIPALIKELRRRLDLTQEQFAQRVGVTYSTVNHWENGKRTPQPFLVQRLLELKREVDAIKPEGRSGARTHTTPQSLGRRGGGKVVDNGDE